MTKFCSVLLSYAHGRFYRKHCLSLMRMLGLARCTKSLYTLSTLLLLVSAVFMSVCTTSLPIFCLCNLRNKQWKQLITWGLYVLSSLWDSYWGTRFANRISLHKSVNLMGCSSIMSSSIHLSSFAFLFLDYILSLFFSTSAFNSSFFSFYPFITLALLSLHLPLCNIFSCLPVCTNYIQFLTGKILEVN